MLVYRFGTSESQSVAEINYLMENYLGSDDVGNRAFFENVFMNASCFKFEAELYALVRKFYDGFLFSNSQKEIEALEDPFLENWINAC